MASSHPQRLGHCYAWQYESLLPAIRCGWKKEAKKNIIWNATNKTASSPPHARLSSRKNGVSFIAIQPFHPTQPNWAGLEGRTWTLMLLRFRKMRSSEHMATRYTTNYDPIWCHVRDPESFLSRKCPNAESILEKIEAIYQVQPKSALFKLPALQNPDVRNWMSSVFPVDLKRLKDSEKEPLDLARIQNEALRLSLEEVRVQLVQQTRILERMKQKFERRTAVFSPAKGYSNEAYARSGAANLVWPPIFGQKYVAWPEIFSLIHDPQSLFGVWKPSKSLNEMTFTEVWNAWSVGEATEGPIPGQKPPLRLVEQYFKAKWRSTGKASLFQSRKFWERFREIPEWIETETSINSKSPEANWRHSEIISQNGVRQQLRPRLPSDNLTSGNGDGAEATSSSTIPSKRKAPVVSRAKSAKFPKSK
ncbi:hypothetical protein C8J57DRAFT_1246766 [Mycena rebaudengoi]|nr:hypothetical protein C8J57DRAFT_1246766 [Mycena rebaudengoi]